MTPRLIQGTVPPTLAIQRWNAAVSWRPLRTAKFDARIKARKLKKGWTYAKIGAVLGPAARESIPF
jgi:hypothetical protein